MYTLSFPFRLPEGQVINTNENLVKIGRLEFSLTQQTNWYILKVEGFKSEEEAKESLKQLWSGFMWVTLNTNIAPNAALEFQEVKYLEDPIGSGKHLAKSFGTPSDEPVDSLIDSSRPSVFLSDKKIRFITMGDATFTIGTKSERILEILTEHLSFSKPDEPYNDDKLRVAVDLYAAYFTESSANARFLTLVMALETLAQAVPRPEVVRNLLEKWNNEVEQIKLTNNDSELAATLDSLSNELFLKKENSIRSQIRTLVLETLKYAGQEKAEEMAKSAVKIYDQRSKLVHDGKIDTQTLNQSTAQAKSIVEQVLRAKFKSKVE